MAQNERSGRQDERSAATPDKGAEKTYLIEVGGEQRALTVEELLEFAQRCASRLDTADGELPDLQAFIQQYPDVNDIPDEVAEAMRGGQGLLEAYRAYENAKLKDELGAMRKNESNKKQAMGSARGEGGADGELDELMRVFESVFK